MGHQMSASAAEVVDLCACQLDLTAAKRAQWNWTRGAKSHRVAAEGHETNEKRMRESALLKGTSSVTGILLSDFTPINITTQRFSSIFIILFGKVVMIFLTFLTL
jgi:hypothetical protein